jgi:exodeoxyribonuclease V beta subunit
VTLARVAAVLAAHGDTYAERLADPALRDGLRGYLTGSIDLVVRSGERFAVVDYKSNRLADYGPAALAGEMDRAHYRLQGLLYAVVLHRYLRWRLAGYDPSRNLAGVLYLFLRGMGAEGAGVFTWRPEPALVTDLSDALEGGA